VNSRAIPLALLLASVAAALVALTLVESRAAGEGRGFHREGASGGSLTVSGQPAWDSGRGILIAGATVVTMDDAHDVIPHGNVLVRNGRVVSVWRGPRPPPGVSVGDASVVDAGPQELVFPGLINLHDHPSFDFLDPWLPPSSHAIPAQGKAGTDPYANRYWSTEAHSYSPRTQARRRARGGGPAGRVIELADLAVGLACRRMRIVSAHTGAYTRARTYGACRHPTSDRFRRRATYASRSRLRLCF
jgi:hypothetical protein